MGLNKYLFIDRDGTLIEEPSDFQIDSLEKLQLTKSVVPALLELQAAGFNLVMISNQDGLGTDNFPTEDFERPQEKMMSILSSQGVFFKQVLICPHLPADNCMCRKPHLGLVRELLTHAEIDFDRSYVIGDRVTDLQLASNMGIKGILFSDQEPAKISQSLGVDEQLVMDWKQITSLLTTLPRRATVKRSTHETNITCTVDLDSSESASISTGIGFFDHMLEQISKHAGIKIQVDGSGDLQVDEHHTVEDVAITLGGAIKQALGDKIGIQRYGFLLPMDESLSQVAIDLSGRPHLEFSWQVDREFVGELATEMVPHFFKSLAGSLGATIHIQSQGKNDHHAIEGIFKAFAKSLGQAVRLSGAKGLPSTKGAL